MVPSVQPEYPEYSVEIDMGLKIQVDNRDTSRRFDFDCKVEPVEFTPVPEPDYVDVYKRQPRCCCRGRSRCPPAFEGSQ